MGELQIALLILGAMIIIAVIIYNRVQEARFRERAEDAFAPASKETSSEITPGGRPNNGQERIEPQFQGDDAAVVMHDRPEPRALGAAASVVPSPTPEQVETLRAVVKPTFDIPPVEAEESPAAAVTAPISPTAEPLVEAPAQAAEVVTTTADAGVEIENDDSQADTDDDPLSYVARITAREPLPVTAVEQMLRAMIGQTGRVQVEGRSGNRTTWVPVEAGRVPDDLLTLRASLQLIDRRGMVTQQDIAQFQSAVARCAGAANAGTHLPQAEAYLVRTRELDRFSAEVDVLVGINVVAPRGRPFSGTRVRGLVEAAGFKADDERYTYVDGNNTLRFSLENQDQSPLTAESLRNGHVSGLTLLLDVPRQSDGVATFNQMVQIGRQLAQSLGGTLVDDNGAPVTDAGLEQIRNQLRGIYHTMQARGIAPGSTLAGRLFG
ncbi:MAG: hypothetical protein KIS79_15415 [Burkholderiales bacterium]|nr:hypothetical protein [Burkholderiales bacterium]